MSDSIERATADGAKLPAEGAGGALDLLRTTFPGVEFSAFEPSTGPRQEVAHVAPAALRDFVEAAKDAGYRMFIDLCGVDYLRREPRYEVVVTLLSLDPPGRLRIRVPVTADALEVPSITAVFAGANFYERETYDLFGIGFAGHPDLSRILLPDDWEGHPLRKDYAVGSVPVQFKGAHKAT